MSVISIIMIIVPIISAITYVYHKYRSNLRYQSQIQSLKHRKHTKYHAVWWIHESSFSIRIYIRPNEFFYTKIVRFLKILCVLYVFFSVKYNLGPDNLATLFGCLKDNIKHFRQEIVKTSLVPSYIKDQCCYI